MANPLDLVFGQRPQVAPYTPTELSVEQLRAIMENISSFPEIQQLGGLYERYMLDAFNEAIPGFSNLLASGGRISQQMLDEASPLLRGEIPQDVQEQVQRSTAYQSLLGGTAGSPMSSALTARDLGLTSLNLMNQGAQLATEGGNAAQRWAGLASGMIMSPSGMMVTPQQQAALTMQNNLYRQATQQLRYNIAAAPDPAAAGVSGTLMNLLGAYLGHGMGGGGGSITPSYGSFGYGSGGAGGVGGWGSNIGQGTGAGSTTMAGFNTPAPTGGVPTAAMTYGDVFNPLGDPYGLGGYYG